MGSVEPLKSPWVKMGFLTCSTGAAALQPDWLSRRCQVGECRAGGRWEEWMDAAVDGVDRQDLISSTFHQTLWHRGGSRCLRISFLSPSFLFSLL